MDLVYREAREKERTINESKNDFRDPGPVLLMS